MNLERRTFKAEVRKSDNGRKIVGTAVVFNQRSDNLGGFVEVIDPAAFDSCDMSDVRCLFNHSDNHVLGRTASNTLTLTRDARGMNFECDPPDTTYARDLAASMDRGDIDECSFSFIVAPGGAAWSQDAGTSLRTVRKISKLWDVSVVTFAAYPKTSSELRSNADILSERHIEAPPVSGGIAADPLLRHKTELAFYQHV